MEKINENKGYLTRPKNIKGYSIVKQYCECGCKKGYYYYKKIKKKKIEHVVISEKNKIINIINKKIRNNIKIIEKNNKSKNNLKDWYNVGVIMENDTLKKLREEIKQESKKWKSL